MNVANRFIWAGVGGLLLAIGVLGVLASRGLLGVSTSSDLVAAPPDRPWRPWGGWAPAVVVVGALLLAVLGVLLVVAELTRRGGADLPDLVADADRTRGPREPGGPGRAGGRTRVSVAGLDRAVAADVAATAGVSRATVHLAGAAGRSRLYLRLAVGADTDVAAVRRQVEASVRRLAVTSGLRPTTTDVTVRFSDQPSARVI